MQQLLIKPWWELELVISLLRFLGNLIHFFIQGRCLTGFNVVYTGSNVYCIRLARPFSQGKWWTVLIYRIIDQKKKCIQLFGCCRCGRRVGTTQLSGFAISRKPVHTKLGAKNFGLPLRDLRILRLETYIFDWYSKEKIVARLCLVNKYKTIRHFLLDIVFCRYVCAIMLNYLYLMFCCKG